MRSVDSYSPPVGVLKFVVDRAAKGLLGLVEFGGVLRNHEGHVLLSCSNFIALEDSK